MEKKIGIGLILILIFSGLYYYHSINKVNCQQITVNANAIFMDDNYATCGKDFKLYNRSENTITLHKMQFNGSTNGSNSTEVLDTYTLKPDQGINVEANDRIYYEFVPPQGNDLAATQLQLTNKTPINSTDE